MTSGSFDEMDRQPVPTDLAIIDRSVDTRGTVVEASPLNDSVVVNSTCMDDSLTAESVAKNWKIFQFQTATFFEHAKIYLIAFFRDNQQLLVTLGILFLAITGAKLLFAGLSALDSIPLFTPLLKVVGLISVVRFVLRYLIRAQNRQELVESLNQIKSEVFGS